MAFKDPINLSAMGQGSSKGFVARPIGGGAHAWTLTTLMGLFLREVEARYGRRDLEWTPLGIEFAGDKPNIWYPNDCRHIAVRLTDLAAHDILGAVFELAHETIHLLSPSGRCACIVLEEGLATLYADEVAERCGSSRRADEVAYQKAAIITQDLLNIDADSIRRIRSHHPHFNDWTPDIILQEVPALSEHAAAELCQPFRYDAAPMP